MIEQFLDKASKAYYEGKPIISDAEFDRLAEVYGYDKVGAGAVKGIPHFFRMYSLQKIYEGDPIPKLHDPVRTPKLDGAAVSLLYLPLTDGSKHELVRILTRGDGIKGLDVTPKLQHLTPKYILGFEDIGPIQVNAELVAPSKIENARNYAAGAMNLKNIEEIKSRSLTIVAHDIIATGSTSAYDCSLALLADLDFNVINQDMSKFPTDGQVVRENSYERYIEAGFTAKHPRAAYALKPKPTIVTTDLIDVEWQVGRSGVVSPVAILSPVVVGDATVSRCTLHNIGFIRELGLEIGCTVELVRSGEIIPRIVRRVV